MRSVRHYLRHLAIRLANLSQTLTTGVCIEIKNSMDWTIYNDIFVDGDYDEPILRLLSSGNKQKVTVLDLGSNVGFFTLRLVHLTLARSAMNPFAILGVEASRMLCDESLHRIRASTFPLTQFQITIQPGLIGNREGEGTYYHFKDHGLNSVFRKNGEPEIVPFLNISPLVDSWEKIDLLKCDIEGAELSFLKNYEDLLQKTRTAVFEFHTEFCDYKECVEIIRAAGFLSSKVIRKSQHAVLEYFWK